MTLQETSVGDNSANVYATDAFPAFDSVTYFEDP
jgi:hypothetical protein